MPKIKKTGEEQTTTPLDDFIAEIDSQEGGVPAEQERELDEDIEPDIEQGGTPPKEEEEEEEIEEEQEEEEAEEEEEEEPGEDEETEYELETEEEEEESDTAHLENLNRQGLIKYAKDNKLNVRLLKKDSDEEIMQKIAEAESNRPPDQQAIVDLINEYIDQPGQPDKGKQGEQQDLFAEFMGGQTQPGQQPPQQQQPGMQNPQQLQTPQNMVPQITEEQYQQALQSREGFTQVLTNFAQNMWQNAIPVAQQNFAQRLIPAMQQYMVGALALQSTINNFYADKPHLKPMKKLVSAMAGAEHSANPQKSYEDILLTVAGQIEQKLNIKPGKKTTTETKPKKRKKASFAGGGSGKGAGRKPKKKVKTEEDDIYDTITKSDDPFAGRI